MRAGWLAILAGCSGYAVGEVPPGRLCVTLEGVEQCGDATAVSAAVDGGTRVVIQGEVPVSGAELGYDRVDTVISLVVNEGEAQGEASVVPALLTCLLDISHGGDHCHLGIPTDRGCEVPLTGADFRSVWVDTLNEDRVAGRFAAKVAADPPACCASNCAEVDRPPGVEPAGPWRVEGAFDVIFSPPG